MAKKLYKYKLSWKSKSGVPYSSVYHEKNEEDAIKEWKKSWKHIPKRQITSIKKIP